MAICKPPLSCSLGRCCTRLQHEAFDCIRDAALIVGADHMLCRRSRLRQALSLQ